MERMHLIAECDRRLYRASIRHEKIAFDTVRFFFLAKILPPEASDTGDAGKARRTRAAPLARGVPRTSRAESITRSRYQQYRSGPTYCAGE
jgi:hypothetical protein